MKVLFLAFTCKTFNNKDIYIDRPDLTRKMGCMETWVPRVEALGHKVVFFDGSNDIEEYDEKYNILHTTSDDSYDFTPEQWEVKPSLLFRRLQSAIKWSLENFEFDYIFRTDDGSYINAYVIDQVLPFVKNFDFVLPTIGGGGGGMFISRRGCEGLIGFENPKNIALEDQVVVEFFEQNRDLYRTGANSLLQFQYVVSEKYFCTHYTTGKRQYFIDLVISSYYNNVPLPRKVAINFPIYSITHNRPNTWYTPSVQTPLWYYFDRDFYNWEHYGPIARSYFSHTTHNPFVSNTLSELLFYDTDLSEFLFTEYLSTLTPLGKLSLFYTDKNKQLPQYIDKYCNIEEENECLNLSMEFFGNESGKFFRLSRK